jgi:hypothetical protein
MTLKRSPLHAPRHARIPEPSRTSTVTPSEKVHRLDRVAIAASAFESARAALHQAVHAALEHGASWSEIGGVLGVSRQAAFQRFGPKQGLRDVRGASET